MRPESYESNRLLQPGERIDPATGAVFYSAAWLNKPRIVLDSRAAQVEPDGNSCLDESDARKTVDPR